MTRAATIKTRPVFLRPRRGPALEESCLIDLGRTIAPGFALAGFVVAIMAGTLAENPVGRVLQCAIISMIGCYVVGRVIGMVAARAAAEHLSAYRAAHPAGEQRAVDSAEKT